MRAARRWWRSISSENRSRASSSRPAACKDLTSTATRASASLALTGGGVAAPDMGYVAVAQMFTEHSIRYAGYDRYAGYARYGFSSDRPRGNFNFRRPIRNSQFLIPA